MIQTNLSGPSAGHRGAEAVGHAFDDFDLVVDAFQQAAVRPLVVVLLLAPPGEPPRLGQVGEHLAVQQLAALSLARKLHKVQLCVLNRRQIRDGWKPAAKVFDVASHELGQLLRVRHPMTEVAGRPERWENGVRTMHDEPLVSAWADPQTVADISGRDMPAGKCLMQCDNAGEIYSFHAWEINFVFADGHVTGLSRQTDPKVLLALVTPDRADGS